MARKNPPRSIGGEANLAIRIERELGSQDWSPAELADRLTAIGCPIQTSAIYKVLKGDPPRRITVDELIGLATVFDTTIDDLLTPVDTLDKRRAQELLKLLESSDSEMITAISTTMQAYADLFTLSIEDEELFEYVKGYRFRSGDPGPSDSRLFTLVGVDGTEVDVSDEVLRRTLLDLEAGLMEQARQIAVAAHRNKKGLDDGKH